MGCTAMPPCQLHPMPLEAINVEWGGPAVGRKALAFPKRRTIYLDPAFWRSIRTIDGRKAILAHERAHIEGARCESCADRRAGEILREEGVPTPRDGARVMLGRLENRDGQRAASELLDGYGLDSTTSYLHNRQRAAACNAELQGFLDELAASGVYFNGHRYHVTVGWDGGGRSPDKQRELYAKGRDTSDADPRKWPIVDASQVVTWTLQSAHLIQPDGTCKAVDLHVMEQDGTELLYASQSPIFEELYEAMADMGRARGLNAGYFWTPEKKDRGHFETQAAGKLVASLGPALFVLGALFVLSRF